MQPVLNMLDFWTGMCVRFTFPMPSSWVHVLFFQSTALLCLGSARVAAPNLYCSKMVCMAPT